LPAIEIESPLGAEPAPSVSAPRLEISAPQAPVLDGALALGVLLLAAFLASFAALNADLWLNLAAGRLVANGQYSFGTDPFGAVPSWTWINHAWLFDLFLYLLYHPGGAALVAAKAGVVVAVAGVLLALRRPNGGGLGPAAATGLVLLAASPLFALRSSVVSYLLFTLLLLILHRRLGPSGRWQLPAAVGIQFALWVNLDGGFVFGLVLLAVWTVGAFLQQVLPLGEGTDDPGEAPHPPVVLLIASLAALIGCLLNPYQVRVFQLPAELAVLTLPDALRTDLFVEQYLRDQFLASPFNAAYLAQVGQVAAWALYLLLAAGLASFAVNTGGWRWRRVLAWTAFACLGTTFGRTVPYFALIGGPAVVLNFQAALARRRADWAETANRRADHLRAMLAAAGRTGLLLGFAILLALAWPGWLGADSGNAAAPTRRVAWQAVPDPTQERLATRLDGWYKAGDLPAKEARGFHLQPDFGMYCAWFCPAEKSMFDSRLTAPPDVAADYLALRRAVLGLGRPPGPDHPGPPEPLLRKFGVTHLVLSGVEVLNPPPLLTGLGEVAFADPGRWAPWAIAGRGVICGLRNSYPKLRLDPIRLAVGDTVEPLSAPPEVAPPTPPTALERYRTAWVPTAPEAAEAGLWLAYHEATAFHGNNVAIPAALIAAEIVRPATLAAPTLSPPPVFQRGQARPATLGSPLIEVKQYLEDRWRRTSTGRAGRSATLLAIRAARRAILVNPEHPQAYGRLAQAYSLFETDPVLGSMQELTAARQALTRFAVLAAYRAAPTSEEMVLHNELFNLYQRVVIPGTQARPEDLILESLTKFIELRRSFYAPRAGADPEGPEARQFDQEEKALRQELEGQGNRVRKLSDDYENATPRDAPPARRAATARHFGLTREALKVLQQADPKDRDVNSVLMMAQLFLLVGEAENARDLLQVAFPAVEQAPPQLQLPVHALIVQAAAALGDYPTAIDHCDAMLALTGPATARATAGVLSNLVFPDAAPIQPLMRISTIPAWMSDLSLVVQSSREVTDWTVRKGMLALEGGDVPLARRQLTEGARGRFPTETRTLAQHWLELWR
jgi:hypothetical protein